MLARDEILQALARYARGVDRADADLLKSCYHPDAIEEHGGNYTGNAFDYVDGAVPRIRLMGAMQHLLGTSHIEFDGDVAWVETYLWTFARFAADGKSTDTFTGGRLIDRFERLPGSTRVNIKIVDGDETTDINTMTELACKTALHEGFAQPGDNVVIAAGVPFGRPYQAPFAVR